MSSHKLQIGSGSSMPCTDDFESAISCAADTQLALPLPTEHRIKKAILPGNNQYSLETSSPTSRSYREMHSIAISKESGRAENDITWFQPVRIVRNVAARKRISGKEFSILNGWGFLLLILLNGLIFGTLAIISIRNTKLHTPVREKRTAITCIILTWFIILVELLLTNVYLLTKLRHPLVLARGARYIIVTAIGIFGSITPLAVLALIQIRVVQTHLAVPISMLTLSVVSSVIFLGAQVCRQRLIYILFEVKMQNSKSIYRYSYLYVAAFALLVGVSALCLGLIHNGKYKHWVPLPANIGFYTLLLCIGYYTYKSRRVTMAFSDWRSNMLVVTFYTLTTTIGFVVRIACMSGITNSTHAITHSMMIMTFIPFYSISYCLSVCTVFLMGQISIITFFELELESDLNPRATFETRQDKSTASMPTTITQAGLLQHTRDMMSSTSQAAVSQTPQSL